MNMKTQDKAPDRLRLREMLERPNPKNPWARRLGKKSVLKWRLKQALRTAGLHHSFFTKPRTNARVKNYAEALRALPSLKLRQQAIWIWGRPGKIERKPKR